MMRRMIQQSVRHHLYLVIAYLVNDIAVTSHTSCDRYDRCTQTMREDALQGCDGGFWYDTFTWLYTAVLLLLYIPGITQDKRLLREGRSLAGGPVSYTAVYVHTTIYGGVLFIFSYRDILYISALRSFASLSRQGSRVDQRRTQTVCLLHVQRSAPPEV